MSENIDTEQVFVIGCPRSGTSVLSWALAEHPLMWTSAESDFMHQMFKGNCLFDIYKKSIDRPDVGWLEQNGVTYREFASYIGVGINQMFRSRSKGLIWIDQTPGHTLIAPVLSDMFPKARFVHIVRDGRKVVNSMLNSGFQNIGFNMKWTTDFEQACRTWNTYVSKGGDFVQRNPKIAIQISNEDMASDPVSTFRKVHEFLNLPPCEGAQKLISTSRLNSSFDSGFKVVANSTSVPSVESKVSPDWHASQLELFEDICGDSFDKLGYQLVTV